MGIDLGGTSTRAELVDESGVLLGRGLAGGANLRSAGGGLVGAADAVRTAAEMALAAAQNPGSSGPGDVPHDVPRNSPHDVAHGAPHDLAPRIAAGRHRPRVVVVAASGAGPARHDEVAEAFRDALTDICDRVHVENDLAAAFRSASSGGDGYLLLSGTGAVAGRFRGGVLQRRADGLGWILGDTGSGLWIGWQGLRAAAADLDGRGPRTELTGLLVTALGVSPVTGDPCQDLVRRVDDLAPAQMGSLAPFVLGVAGHDAVASRIAERAGRALVTSLDAVIDDAGTDGAGTDHARTDGLGRPGGTGETAVRPDAATTGMPEKSAGGIPHEVVLAGGVLSHPNPVRDAVLAALEDRSWRVVTAAEPVIGAVRIAQDLLAKGL
ncbi:hypothetical protein C0Z10_13270 [Acidipropionibacterium jensenii]|uniref:ATPase BadF/BadG/BcrA/BcrD type domain-containing protein n=1 Tax=Acidipropionibacterium jensenii TaxID=1749 RepID=A0A3T0S2E3_9ACTN|nr:BadF/BadG/BcrA/BcrD ATPase family protein [Acidipropionibacterium jensenii]AZZ40546.1 hypothetical protein C0Z10_13270 [Acidipropionibacterium jensenii]